MRLNVRYSKELDFIWEISQTLACNLSSAEISEGLYIVLEKYLNVSSTNILFYDETQNLFVEFDSKRKPLSSAQQKKYAKIFEKLNSTMRLNFILNDNFFVINDDFHIDYEIALKKDANTYYIPLKQNYKCIGFIELEQKNSKFDFITKELLKVLFVVAAQITNVITNQKLNLKITKIADFYKAQKNIAKILETQYDYSFLIPVIGEILDNFAKEYFAYIFMKEDDGSFKLSWPLRYDKKRLTPLLENTSLKNRIKVNDDQTAVLFPIYFDNILKGAIIIDGKDKKISPDDIQFLMQLSSQTATTLDKAGVYAEIEKYATQDALTGLNNRRSLDLRIVQEVAMAKRKDTPLCVMMLDIDFFKKINDTYGHYVGDVVLKRFANIINDEIREYDFPARYGGEEFFIILPSTTLKEAEKVASRLREKIEQEKFDIAKFSDNIKFLNITTSIGLVKLEETMSVKNLYLKVDKALYEAKSTGRNKVVIL